MTNIKLYVTRTEICVTVDGKLTSGMVGVPCTLEYGPEWEGLNKTAVFTAGCITRDVVNAEGTVEVPAECLEFPGVRLSVGFYGFNADEVVVIPTVTAPVGHIFPGADPSGDPGTDPELPIWANHEARIKKIEEEGDGGGGSGKPGADGGYYTPTVSQPDANHATFTFEPSKEGMAEVPQQTVTLPAGPKGEPGERGPQGEAGPAGADGKDGVIALTGAKVGDIARVAAVDDNGVPTAWEPVDMPSGGEEKRFKRIAESGSSGYLSEIEHIIEDDNGYSEFYIQIRNLMTESLTAVNIVLYINDIDTGLRVNTGTHGWGQTGRIYGRKVSDTDWIILKGPFAAGSGGANGDYGTVTMSRAASKDEGNMKKIRFTIQSDAEVFAMEYCIWGR